jgi:predicted transcriptional regulator
MKTLSIHIGVDLTKTADRVKDAIRRHEAGEHVDETHISFESWDMFTRVLTGKRVELLRHLHRNPESSIRSLSKALGRDYSNVHADVQALIEAGLIDDQDGLRVEYDDIQPPRLAL